MTTTETPPTDELSPPGKEKPGATNAGPIHKSATTTDNPNSSGTTAHPRRCPVKSCPWRGPVCPVHDAKHRDAINGNQGRGFVGLVRRGYLVVMA